MARSTATNIEFAGNAAQALTYYHDLLGGELQILRYSDFPGMDLGMDPAPDPDLVAHGIVHGEGFAITAGDDIMESAIDLTSEGYSLMHMFTKVAEAQELWDRYVSSGSTVEMPFEEAPWGGWFGALRDPFGVQWNFSADDE